MNPWQISQLKIAMNPWQFSQLQTAMNPWQFSQLNMAVNPWHFSQSKIKQQCTRGNEARKDIQNHIKQEIVSKCSIGHYDYLV